MLPRHAGHQEKQREARIAQRHQAVLQRRRLLHEVMGRRRQSAPDDEQRNHQRGDDDDKNRSGKAQSRIDQRQSGRYRCEQEIRLASPGGDGQAHGAHQEPSDNRWLLANALQALEQQTQAQRRKHQSRHLRQRHACQDPRHGDDQDGSGAGETIDRLAVLAHRDEQGGNDCQQADIHQAHARRTERGQRLECRLHEGIEGAGCPGQGPQEGPAEPVFVKKRHVVREIGLVVGKPARRTRRLDDEDRKSRCQQAKQQCPGLQGLAHSSAQDPPYLSARSRYACARASRVKRSRMN
jgi:hypothetical protein